MINAPTNRQHLCWNTEQEPLIGRVIYLVMGFTILEVGVGISMLTEDRRSFAVEKAWEGAVVHKQSTWGYF